MKSLRILFITPYVPSLIRVRSYNFIKRLSLNGHRITVLAICTSAQEAEDVALLRNYCEQVETVYVSLARSLWNCTRSFFTNQPLQASYCYSPLMQRLVQAALNGKGPPRSLRNPGLARDSFDLVHVEHLRSVRFGLTIKDAPCVYDSVDCISLLLERARQSGSTLSGRLKSRLDLKRTRRYESELPTQFSRILISAEDDRQALEKLSKNLGSRHGVLNGARAEGKTGIITVVPNGVDLNYFQPGNEPRDPATLIYSGRMSYHANVHAALYLIREIMPLIWARHPQAKLLIVGTCPPRTLRELGDLYKPKIIVTGHVPDIRPYLLQATVSVSPLLYSVGCQNKLLEAMATATPVVTTSHASKAIGARDGKHLLEANGSEMFANKVAQLLEDRDLQRQLGTEGRNYVESCCDWKTIVDHLETIYRSEINRFKD